MVEKKISLKLLIDTKANKVLFAESGKDFVDFLLYLLALPLGSVITFLSKPEMVGSLGNLYQSIEDLGDAYLLHPNNKRDDVLKAKPPPSHASIPLLTDDNSYVPSRKLYTCSSSYSHYYVTESYGRTCPRCSYGMTSEVSIVGPVNSSTVTEPGYVKGLVTYMVTDDLSVQPMSMISGISLLNECSVNDFSALQEKVVDFEPDEAIKLLKASLQTKGSLTYVFLGSIKTENK